MKEKLMILSLGIGLLAVSAAQSLAQTRTCGPRDIVLQRLTETYGETRQSIGLGHNNAIIEVFASSSTGTWTITVTTAGGTTCLVASGQAFETLAEQLPVKEQEA
ncbi:MAG: hypothetical protein MK160_10560 [Rhodobacteraceae bacterium]|nr:hypothetical protein [Paracoccaceae bacterium]